MSTYRNFWYPYSKKMIINKELLKDSKQGKEWLRAIRLAEEELGVDADHLSAEFINLVGVKYGFNERRE